LIHLKFSCHSEYGLIATYSRPLNPPEDQAVLSRPILLEQLLGFAKAGFLYAIVDSTDLPIVPPKMNELGPARAMSLFSGSRYHDHWAVAPYLVTVDDAILTWILETLGDGPWGVLVLSKEPPDTVFLHFQSQMLVTLADGQQWFFRYYDPRVLERHLKRAQRGRIEAFFGPARSFVILDGPDGSGNAYALAPPLA
jgi:hypothetical protein